MSVAAIAVAWRAREPPLAPAAVLARGTHAVQLARRAFERLVSGATLEGVFGADSLVLTGPAEHLPWVDGVIYLGRDPFTSSLLLPTMLEPSVPAALLEQAVRRRFGAAGPLALVPRAGGVDVLPLSASRVIDGDLLQRWVAQRSGTP